MKAVIIAGGHGSRLRPLTYDIPKPIVPICNQPFLFHQIAWLKRYGIEEIILNLHYLSHTLEDTLGNGSRWGVKLHYTYESEPLGTAGAVKNAQALFDRDPMIVLNGDIFADLDLSALLKFHYAHQGLATLALTKVKDPTAYGLISLDERHCITRFLEKPTPEEAIVNTVNAGIYVLDPAVFELVPQGEPYSFERGLFPHLVESGKGIYGYPDTFYWLDIGTISKYRQAHHDVLAGHLSFELSGTAIAPGIWVGEGTTIDSTAELQAPVVIGAGVSVGANCVIEPFSVIGDRCQIGESTLISDSILWDDARIGQQVHLRGCMIGARVQIEDEVRIGDRAVLSSDSVVKKGSLFHA